MVKCIYCRQVSGISKTGRPHGRQRYRCSHCDRYFTDTREPLPGTGRNGSVTIKDLAAELGLGISTVSRAMNGGRQVSAQTRKLVREAAEKMGYQTNPIAVSLVKRRSNTIGVIVPELRSDFYSNLVLGIDDVLKSKGYRMYIMQSDESYGNEVANTEALVSDRVDGIMASTTFRTKDFAHFQRAMQKRIPVVFFSRINRELSSPKVVVDNYEGGCMAARHLMQKGYRKIGYLGGSEDFFIGNLRYQGFLDTLRANGLDCHSNGVMRDDRLMLEPEACINAFFRRKKRPDAVFTMTDTIGIEVIRFAADHGIDIPNELGVIGFSDYIVSRYISPSLSTIRQPTMDIGREAATRLLRAIEGIQDGLHRDDTTTCFKPDLIARGSTDRLSTAYAGK